MFTELQHISLLCSHKWTTDIYLTLEDFAYSDFPPLDLESIISLLQKDYLKSRLEKVN